MTAGRLEEIKERLTDATPGPWGWSGCANDRVDVCSKAVGWEGAEIAVVTKDYEFNNRDGLVDGMPVMDRAMAHANAALIMHAPTDLRELVAEVERLKGKLMEEARWVYDTGQRAKDAQAEVERLRTAIGNALTNEKLEWGPDEGGMTWHEAVAFAAAKGDGWRLPSVPELVAQFDYDKSEPKGAGWKREWYWSSSSYAGGTAYAWTVHFYYGSAITYDVGYNYRVRCVRSVGGES